MYAPHIRQAGFSFVEIIIVSALSAMVFGALFSSFQYTLSLISDGRAKLSALSVANDRMEYFRSLPYDDVGTISGIPPGTIPQNSTTTLNGIEFVEKVLVEYVDDPADGLETATSSDDNNISSDYKRIEVEYTWDIGNGPHSISLTSNIVPRSVESNIGGGTIRINVIDADSLLLPGASVRFINNTTTSTIDTTRTTNASGAALLSGAPAASDYEVIVTANIGGRTYSIDRTHKATTSNPNPAVAPFAVLEADVSTLTFQIGELSDVEISTYSDVTEGSLREEFLDLLSVSSSTNIEVVGGQAVLENTAGVYVSQGTIYTAVASSSPLERWETIKVAADTVVGTDYVVRLYTKNATGTLIMVPDSDLSGNSVGFTDSLIDISALDTSSYPAIIAAITLSTSDTSITPQIDDIEIFYTQNKTTLSSNSFAMTGTKTIGTDAFSTPIFKHDFTFTTDANGEYTVTDLEFDQYTIENLTGRDIASACPSYPFVHQAGVDGKLALTFVPDDTRTVRVQTIDGLGRAIPGVDITLSRPGYTQTARSNVCGQTFFTGGIADADDYTLQLDATGYVSQTITDLAVSDDVVQSVTLLK